MPPGALLEVIAEATAVHLVVAGAEEARGCVEVEAVSGAPEGGEVPGPPTRERREHRVTRTWDRPRLVTLVPASGAEGAVSETAPFRRWHLCLRFPEAGARVYTVSFSGPASGASSCDAAGSSACSLVEG